MLKALFKKQLMEINEWLIFNRKTGKRRSGKSLVGFLLLYILLFAYLGVIFYMLGNTLCEPLVSLNLDWFYFGIMGSISILFGTFGSVFSTFSSLYNAKDNELLLSMPVPPMHILTVRLFGVWFWGLIYEAIIFIPALIVYWMTACPSVLTVLSGLLLMLVLSVFILTLSSLLGWVVAKISKRLKNKSFITVILALAFFALYYWGYMKAYFALNKVLENAAVLSGKVKGYAYPLYIMGRMGSGEWMSALFFTATVAALFALVLLIMSRSFLKIATSGGSHTKAKYNGKPLKTHSLNTALLLKEAKRFTSSANYMLNCGLGTILLPALGVFALIKSDMLSTFAGVLGSTAPLIVCAAICSMTSMNDITAPSVSLEGKGLWLLQSLPVSPWQVLKAKLKLHILLTGIPTVFCCVCVVAALRMNIYYSVMTILLPLLFMLLSASFGLFMDVRSPNLNWTNEIVPLKQSLNVFIAIFGSWGFLLALGGLYFAVRSFLPAEAYLAVCAALICLCAFLLINWLKKRGAKIFASL